jgi:hypothetical protein
MLMNMNVSIPSGTETRITGANQLTRYAKHLVEMF